MFFARRLKSGEMKQGFTLIELSFSIVFIAILSITIVLIINDSISSYHRGIVLGRINTTGMDLVDDMRAAVQNSNSRNVGQECARAYDDTGARSDCESEQGLGLVMLQRKVNMELGDNMPVSGVFCTGDYSYIWNSGYFSPNSEHKLGSVVSPTTLRYRLQGESGSDAKVKSGFKLLKVKDDSRNVCIAAGGGRTVYSKDGIMSSPEINISDINIYEALEEEPIDILGGGDTENNLAIYDLTSAAPATSDAVGSIFYSASFILGTIQGGINVNAAGNFCATPEGYDAAVQNFDYCAINKFNFAAQAIGG